jgi:hypothetical protein
MDGDARRRFCDGCGRYVHAVAAYSDREWAAMLAEGRVCAYSEGEGAEAPRSRRAVVAGALLTTISPLLAQTGRLRVTVVDVTDAAVGRAEVALVCANGTERTAKADEAGVAVFADLPLGDCRIRVASPGFVVWRGKATIDGAEVRVAAKLQIGKIEMGTWVEAPRRKWYRLWRR